MDEETVTVVDPAEGNDAEDDAHGAMEQATKGLALVPNGKAALDVTYALGVVVDMNGLEFRDGAREPTLQEWLQVGKNLFSVFESMHFCVGDWINAGEAFFGEEIYDAFTSPLDRATAIAPLTLRDPQTLINWASTARKVAKERRRMKPREDDPLQRKLTYEHHYAVAPLEPAEQVEWLDRAIEKGWSSRELREAIQKAKNPSTADEDLDNGNGSGGGDGLTIAERIERAAMLVYKQGEPRDGGAFVPNEPWHQLGSALGQE